MTAPEAATLLSLPPGATAEQIEARFLELRATLEEKIGRAPTPGLKAKYRETLDEITLAFETLTLAADSSALPVLRRAEPAPITAAPGPAGPSPTPAGRLPTTVETLLIHLSAFHKGLLLFLVAGLLLSPFGIRYVESANEGRPPDREYILVLALANLPGLLLWAWAWRRSTRRARRRLGEGKRIAGDKFFGGLATTLTLGGAAALAVLYLYAEAGNDSHQRSLARDVLATRLPHYDAEWKECLGAESATLREIGRLEAEEREQVALNAPESARQQTRALLQAQTRYLRWLMETLPAHPARVARLKLDSSRQLLEDRSVTGEHVFSTINSALNDYVDALSDAVRQVRGRKPDPQFVVPFSRWEQAAAKGDLPSMFNLYLTYLDGKGAVEPDRQTALSWLTRAAEAGHARAMHTLGEQYYWERLKGPPPDKAAAHRWFLKAAEAGYPDSILIIARHYLQGEQVEKDPVIAVAWLRRGVKLDDPACMTELGNCLLNGTGAEKDEAAALELWRQAARKDHWKAKEELKKRNLTW